MQSLKFSFLWQSKMFYHSIKSTQKRKFGTAQVQSRPSWLSRSLCDNCTGITCNVDINITHLAGLIPEKPYQKRDWMKGGPTSYEYHRFSNGIVDKLKSTYFLPHSTFLTVLWTNTTIHSILYHIQTSTGTLGNSLAHGHGGLSPGTLGWDVPWDSLTFGLRNRRGITGAGRGVPAGPFGRGRKADATAADIAAWISLLDIPGFIYLNHTVRNIIDSTHNYWEN